ncbi:MAG: site-specific integrase [Acidaminococcales bacterium]|jgi:integrase|nr:site-specific integrase [Acidaminococcales bacterium]
MAKLHGGMYPDKARPGSMRAYIDTPGGNRKWRRFKSEDEAASWLIGQSAEINKGTFQEPSKITVGDWMEEWLDVYTKPKVRTNTYERYAISFAHMEPLYAIPLQKLEPHAVQKFYSTSKLSQNALHKVHQLLKAALRQAANNNYIMRNPLDAVPAPKVKKTEITTFAAEEVCALLEFCKNRPPRHSARYYPLFCLLAMTGARIGEILALKWEDVDLEKRTIFIKNSAEETKTYGARIGDVKTVKGKRKISFPLSVLDAIKSLPHGEGLIFKTRTGNQLYKRNVIRAWEELIAAYNRQKGVAHIKYRSLHKLRHTHATTLLADGDIAIADVSARLGHARISHTLDLYAHARPEQDKKIADKIDGLYKK